VEGAGLQAQATDQAVRLQLLTVRHLAVVAVATKVLLCFLAGQGEALEMGEEVELLLEEQEILEDIRLLRETMAARLLTITMDTTAAAVAALEG
jgi:hypothetical protein